MATLNTAVVLKDVADRLNIGISEIMADCSVMFSVIDEEAYSEFERNHPVGTLFAKCRRPLGFQVTATQPNQLVSILGNANTTRDVLHVAEVAIMKV